MGLGRKQRRGVVGSGAACCDFPLATDPLTSSGRRPFPRLLLLPLLLALGCGGTVGDAATPKGATSGGSTAAGSSATAGSASGTITSGGLDGAAGSGGSAAAAAAAAGGDSAGNGDGTGASNVDGVDEASQALPPDALLRKVKGQLTGLAPSAEELAQLQADPGALRALIREFQQTPEYAARMVDFFTMAFQQGEVTAPMIANVTPYQQGEIHPRVIHNMRESFGRTAMQLVQEGAPFTEVLTTDRFMLTPALMVAYAWLDERQSGDGGGFSDALHDKLGPDARYIMQGDRPIDVAESANESSADFLVFYAPQVERADGGCASPITVDHNDRITLYTHTMGETLMMFFTGTRLQVGFCVYEGPGILDDADFSTWHMVRIRPPAAGEERSWVYDIAHFRQGQDLRLVKPHVGFYTTPAFLYTWQTNTSNQARVTANQTLIAAVGRAFDATFFVEPASKAALAEDHVAAGTDCYGCHITMDPMRQYFRSTFTYNYGLQDNPAVRDLPGVFAFDEETHVGSDIADLGRSLAESRFFAIGWAHKLCTWANAAVCDPTGDSRGLPSDPELARVIEAFESSNYDWNALVEELFSSPLVTYAEPTATSSARGTSVSVKKKQQLCRQWDLRLGLDDACGLKKLPDPSDSDPVHTIATVLPSDAYSRGQVAPSLANDPTLFFFAGVENVCQVLAARVIDAADKPAYSSAQPQLALAAMVHEVMGIPAGTAGGASGANGADQEPLQILTEHFEAAKAEGASADIALRSAFVLACLSPSAVAVGQ